MHNLRLLLLLGLSLLVTGVHAATVTLAWDASPDASVTGYKIYVGTSSNSFTFSTNNVGNVLTTTITNLSNGVTYWFAATAYNVDAESDFSNQVSYRPPFPKPTPPSSLRRVTAAVKEWLNGNSVLALAELAPIFERRKQVEYVAAVPTAYIFVGQRTQGTRN